MSLKATATRSSALLKGLGSSNAQPLTCISFPGPIDGDCEIRNYKVLGSYNWLDSQTPTIAIPGQPRIWQEPSLPLQLSPDSGYTFLDQNAWRSQESPLEPLFRCVEVTQQISGNTSFSLSEEQIDVVTDRSNLRKLNAMVQSMRTNETLAPSKNREFRIDAQLAHNGRTLLLVRYTPRSRQAINPGDTGYGTNFEHATTSGYTPILILNHGHSGQEKLSPSGYHRVARYSLADLNLLVRYEVDAAQQAPSMHNNSPFASEKSSLERKIIEAPPSSTLRHIVSGTLISQDRVMELKTGKLRWSQSFPQLYFSQTPILKLGIHQNGNFSEVQDYTMDRGRNDRFAESNQSFIENLKYLVPVLKQMKCACQQHGHSGKPLAFFWSGAGPLQLHTIKRSKRSHYLPKDILESL